MINELQNYFASFYIFNKISVFWNLQNCVIWDIITTIIQRHYNRITINVPLQIFIYEDNIGCSFRTVRSERFSNGCGKHATLRGDASLGGEEQNLWIPPVLKELTTKNHIARKMQYRSFKVGPRRQRYFSIQTKKRSIAIGGNYWRKYARKIILYNGKMNFVWKCN